MDLSIIITPIITVACTAIASFVTWLLSRKKYQTEVTHNKIENMDDSLSFYEKLTASHNKILSDLLEKYEKLAQTNTELITEVQSLRAQIGILTEILNAELDAVDFEKYGVKLMEDGTLVRA